MVRVKHVAGPGRFAHTSLSGASTHGDEHEVSAEAADYLCDDRGYFERTGEITLGEDEYEVETADPADDILQDMDALTKSELYDLATEAGIDGRSQLTKDELIAALEE